MTASSTAPGLSGDGGQPRRGRQVRLLTVRDLASREPGVVPAHQRLQRRLGRVADRERGSAGSGQPHRVAPAAQGLLSGAEVGAGQQHPGVEQHHRGVTTLCNRLGPRRGHDDRRMAIDLGDDAVACGGHDPGLRKRPPELLGGPLVAEDRGAQPSTAALRATPRIGHGAAPAAGRRGGRSGQRHRPGTRLTTRGGAAAVAGQGQCVPGPRGLHQHRTDLRARLWRASCTSRGIRDGCGSRFWACSVAPLTPTVIRLAQQLARRGDLLRPAGAEEVLPLHAACEAADQDRRVLAFGTHQQRLAGVWVGRPRLGVEVVAVVPDRHQAEVVHRRERSTPGADHDPPGSARHCQEVAVAGCRPAFAREHHMVPCAEHPGQRGIHARRVLDVGHADQRPATTRRRCAGRVREQSGPVVARGRAPHGARRPAISQVLEVGRAVGVVRPRCGCFFRGPRQRVRRWC